MGGCLVKGRLLVGWVVVVVVEKRRKVNGFYLGVKLCITGKKNTKLFILGKKKYISITGG